MLPPKIEGAVADVGVAPAVRVVRRQGLRSLAESLLHQAAHGAYRELQPRRDLAWGVTLARQLEQVEPNRDGHSTWHGTPRELGWWHREKRRFPEELGIARDPRCGQTFCRY